VRAAGSKASPPLCSTARLIAVRRLNPNPSGARSVLRECLGIAAVLALCGCSEPTLLVGELGCGENEGGASSSADEPSDDDGLLDAPWQTSFEDGFCGYRRDAGFCYSNPGAGYRLVTSPVRTGPFAAAFDLDMDTSNFQHQARCVREGTLPDAAVYGAWFFIPSGASDPDNWNLVHFRGGEPGQRGPTAGTWDVTVGQSRTGELALYVADLRLGTRYVQQNPVALPTDRWFHLELYLKRAADPTGEVALFQDGEELIRVTEVVTDVNTLTQWYVGNYALSLFPSQSTLYVDDVSIRLQP
jgi:Polysaccharide lyase